MIPSPFHHTPYGGQQRGRPPWRDQSSKPPYPGKSLAIPSQGRCPAFNEVFQIVLIATRFDLSVCVICLNQETLERWMHHLDDYPASLTLLDTNRATLEDWQGFLRKQCYHIVVLHGARTELQGKRLSADYVKALVDAVPAGLIVMT